MAPYRTGYAAYVPAFRLARDDIAQAVGGRGRGLRAIANFDEDSTTMGAAAARAAIAGAGGARPRIGTLWFATTPPAYLAKSNAAAVHEAAGLDRLVGAYDLGTSSRAGAAALLAAGRGGGIAV